MRSARRRRRRRTRSCASSCRGAGRPRRPGSSARHARRPGHPHRTRRQDQFRHLQARTGRRRRTARRRGRPRRRRPHATQCPDRSRRRSAGPTHSPPDRFPDAGGVGAVRVGVQCEHLAAHGEGSRTQRSRRRTAEHPTGGRVEIDVGVDQTGLRRALPISRCHPMEYRRSLFVHPLFRRNDHAALLDLRPVRRTAIDGPVENGFIDGIDHDRCRRGSRTWPTDDRHCDPSGAVSDTGRADARGAVPVPARRRRRGGGQGPRSPSAVATRLRTQRSGDALQVDVLTAGTEEGPCATAGEGPQHLRLTHRHDLRFGG